MVRDEAGRIARVTYPDAPDKNKPQLELRYEYGAGGEIVRVSAVDMTSAALSTYGPERYVIEYSYDEAGRLVRKCVRANQVEDDKIYYESDYQYDGRGQLIRERILRWDSSAEMMKVTQDVEYTYDLGRNVTQVKLTDDKGWVYTETRSYARGYQLTDFSESHASGVTVVALGSYTYDTNNNMTGTKSIDVKRGDANERLAYRAQWTFTFDRKNRVASHTNQETDLVRHLRWDGLGRVWQRWDYDSDGEEWSGTLARYTYDGSALAQEHNFTASGNGSWTYTYMYLTYDYLRHAAGTRQRKGEVDKSYTDYFLLTDGGTVSGRFTRGASVSLSRAQHGVTGDRQARYAGEGAEPDGGPFTDVSNLGFASSFIESYGGTKAGDAQFFDALNQMGDRHLLVGIDRWLTLRGNNTQAAGIGAAAGVIPEPQPVVPSDGGNGEDGNGMDTETCGCPECCWHLYPQKGCVEAPCACGASKPCWEFMCCRRCHPAIGLLVNMCWDEEQQEIVNCHKACCTQEVYECLPVCQYGRCKDYRCGGDDWGLCWTFVEPNPPGVQEGPIMISCRDVLAELRETIRKMCLQLNESGCFERCDRDELCYFFHLFCTCRLSVKIHCAQEDRFISPNNILIRRARLGKASGPGVLFHELLHMFYYPALAHRAIAGCQEICFWNYERDKSMVSSMADTDAVCCCMDALIPPCEEEYFPKPWLPYGVVE